MGFLDLLRNTTDEDDITKATKQKLKELNAAGQRMALEKVGELERTAPQARGEIMRAVFGPGEFRQPNLEAGMAWYKNAEAQDNMMMRAMLQSALAGKQMHFDIGSNLPGPIYKDNSEQRRALEEQDRKLRDLRAKYGQRGFETLLARMQADQQGG
jgi:hypothetical protein